MQPNIWTLSVNKEHMPQFPIYRILAPSFLFVAICFSSSFSTSSVLAKQKDPKPPTKQLDFTKGDRLPNERSHDWTLGPTGARGWVQVGGQGAAGNSNASRQIYVTQVNRSGPSAKVLAQGDVIVGLNDSRFKSDARIAFARGIEQAETVGNMQLLVFRKGKERTVNIALPKRPAFSDTAPYNCRKSKMLLAEGCKAIQRRGLGRPSIPSHINALALLASGNAAYKKTIRDYARLTVQRPLKATMKLPSWSFSFTNIFLCEYYLITKDRTVLKEIQRLTNHLVQGQGPMGTWGHSFVDKARDRLTGYGAVNAVGVPCAISLSLASECGVKIDGLDEAIELSESFFRRHVNLGAIPYGDGPPNLQYGHDDNGKNSAAALFFSLRGDEPSTRFYTRTAIAAYGADREQGHTGNFFNMLWGLPAVSLAGPDATGPWMKKFGWYYDLARDHEFRFPYQGYPKQRNGCAHSRWDCPGAYLMHFALPLKTLRITGRDVKNPPSFTSQEIADTIAVGNVNYGSKKPQQLQEMLASWSPIARHESAKELKRRKIKLASNSNRMNSKNPIERAAALQVTTDFPASSKMLNDPDISVQTAALSAMIRINRQKAWLATVDHLASQTELSPVLTQAIGSAFFPLSIRANASGKLLAAPTNRRAAHAAINKLLNDEDSLVSSRVAIGLTALPERELASLLPLIYEKGKEGSIGNVMFNNKLQVSCAEVLTKLRLEEGAEVAGLLLGDTSWGKQNRMPQAAKMLNSYGSHAKKHLAPARAALKRLRAEGGNGNAKWIELLNTTIRSIEKKPAPREKLKSIKAI